MVRVLTCAVFASAVLAIACHAQEISYYNLGLLRQPSAALDRAYLGITATHGTNIVGLEAGTNIVFSTNSGILKINVSSTPSPGVTTNLDVVSPNQTNTLQFADGLLTNVVAVP